MFTEWTASVHAYFYIQWAHWSNIKWIKRHHSNTKYKKRGLSPNFWVFIILSKNIYLNFTDRGNLEHLVVDTSYRFSLGIEKEWLQVH